MTYALSTMGTNHHELFREIYGGNAVAFELYNESTYTGSLPEDATPDMVAEPGNALLGGDGAGRKTALVPVPS